MTELAPVDCPAGPSLRALARRRTLRDLRFWAYVGAVLFFAFLAFGPVAASVVGGRMSPRSLGVIVRCGILILVPLCIFNYRSQSIAAELLRSLPITTCRNCLYDTAGVPTDRCPECGQNFATNPPRATP